ncbi:hypothetical protein ACFWF9_10290 [Streptomyces roseolus]
MMAHGESRHRQFGRDAAFETLVARITADRGTRRDPTREAA